MYNANDALRKPARIILLNRFFYPDHSATSQILSDLAFYLAGQGEIVHVLTSRQRYDKPHARLRARERVQGVMIHRVATTRFGRRWLPGRAIDYLSFYLSAGWALLRLARRGNVVVVKTDPPMLSVLVAALKRLRGIQTVNWLQDLYPEVAAELGLVAVQGQIGRVLSSIRNFSLHSASLNIAIGEDMAHRLRALGLSPEKVNVIHNWTDDSSVVPTDHAENPLRREWCLEEKFVVAYSGNLGRAHDIDTLLEAAESLRERADITFLFIGSGHGIAELDEAARVRGLTNVLFKPYQSRKLLSQSLGAGDVHWLSLKAGLDGLILPSKFYGIAAAARPIIVIGSPNGELSRLAERFDCGFQVGLGQSEDLARIIVSLAQDRERCRQMGMNARTMLDEHFTKAQALDRWHAVLRSVAGDTITEHNQESHFSD